jgi:hypothetical protein
VNATPRFGIKLEARLEIKLKFGLDVDIFMENHYENIRSARSGKE